MATSHDLCKEIDATLLELLTAIEEVELLQTQLQSTLSSGHFDMARARYNMGAKAVGALQYPEEMTAGARVELADTKVKLAASGAGDISYQEFVPCENTSVGPVEGSDVRRRVTATDAEDKDETEGKDTAVKDPLKWFGVLVPQPLRQSQVSFKRGVSLAFSVATAQARLTALQQRYSKLLAQKEAS